MNMACTKWHVILVVRRVETGPEIPMIQETIGDAYMAVTNLVKDQSKDHVKRVAEFSLEALEAASQIPIDMDDPSKGFVQIRV